MEMRPKAIRIIVEMWNPEEKRVMQQTWETFVPPGFDVQWVYVEDLFQAFPMDGQLRFPIRWPMQREV